MEEYPTFSYAELRETYIPTYLSLTLVCERKQTKEKVNYDSKSPKLAFIEKENKIDLAAKKKNKYSK